MKLIASPTSPYARKVRIALAEKKIEYELVEAAPFAPDTDVPSYNPLGKVPVLVLDDGTNLFDSRVIVEYLDTVSPVSRLIPEPSRQRIAVKRWEALADGICDAAAAIVLEGRRAAKLQSREWVARQRSKIGRGVTALASELGRGVVEHGPDQLGFLGMEHRLDLDHAVVGVAAPHVATLCVLQRMGNLTVALYNRVLAAQHLQLRRRHEPRVVEQQALVRGRRDP